METEPKPLTPKVPEPNREVSLTLESRAVFYPESSDNMWPIKLHNEKIKQVVEKSLPEMVQALSQPVESVHKDKVQEIFRWGRVSQRHRRWEFKDEEEGGYSMMSRGFRENRGGSENIIFGIKCTFDKNGRMVRYEYIDDLEYINDLEYIDYNPRLYYTGQTIFSVSFVYDSDGYLVQRSLWKEYKPPIFDRFDYATASDGKKTPTLMTRTLRIDGKDTKPITVDLAHYQEWLENNPNGFVRVEKESLNPQELKIEGYTVSEHRSGIHFAHPEDLERALIMYGTGNIPDETPYRYNEKVFTESGGPLSGALFDLVAGRGDIQSFVQKQIMELVSEAYETVQNSQNPDAKEKVHLPFDYDGVGHFHKTSVDVEVTKKGFELHLRAAYVGDQVEESLAKAMGKERGFRSATIEVPVNQTGRDGYFLIDIAEVCQKIGLPVTEEKVGKYITEWFESYRRQSEKSGYEARYGERLVLWEDPSKGVTVTLDFERYDYDADVDLLQFFSADERSIWGPLPKYIRSPEIEVRSTYPRVRILVQPLGDPFDQVVAQQATDTVHTFTSKFS